VQNEVILEGALVGPDRLLGEAGQGIEVVQDALMQGRHGIGALSLGGMKRSAQLMLRYAERRDLGGAALFDQAFLRARLDELLAATTALEALVDHVSAMFDAGRAVPDEATIAIKVAAPELLWRAADRLVQVLGGRGYVHPNLAAGLFEDARLFRIFEGPTEALAAFLGARAVTQPGPLRAFLTEELGAPDCARAVELAAHRAAPAQHVTLGIAVAHAVLEAAARRAPGEAAHRAASWAQSAFCAALAEPAGPVPDHASLAAEIGAFAEAIGDFEPTFAGVDQRLDPLLGRAQPTPLAPQLPAPPPVDPDFEAWLAGWLAARTRLPLSAIDRSSPLTSFGVDSLMAMELAEAIAARSGVAVPESALFEHPTIAAIAARLGRVPDAPQPGAAAWETVRL